MKGTKTGTFKLIAIFAEGAAADKKLPLIYKKKYFNKNII